MTVIAIGSKNPTKEQSVRDTLSPYSNVEVVSVAVHPEVSSQPLSQEETRLGAQQRAQMALESVNADMGIGLEGGVYLSGTTPYLCHWGVLMDKDKHIFVTSGPIIALPESFWERLSQGIELGKIMKEYTGIENLGSKGGAISIFTDGLVTRYHMFTQVFCALWGQYNYAQKSLSHP